MNLKILNLDYENIRGLKNIKISFESPNSSGLNKTSLLMMRNGTGKTTTLSLIRAILDGSAENWDEETVKSFDPKVTEQFEGKFRAKLQIDGRIYFVTLRMDYDTGKATYLTTRIDQVGGGLEPGHLLPKKVKEVFSKEFVERFIFNGELAKEILNSKSDEAEKAIRFLYHLNRIEEMRGRADTILEDEQKKHEKSKISSEQGLSQTISRMKNTKEILDKLRTEAEEIESIIEKKNQRVSEIEDYIDETLRADQNLRGQYEKVEQDKSETVNKIKELSLYMIEDMKSPEHLNPVVAKRLSNLSEKMQKLKLPESTSRQFFEDLAEEDKCICGHPITEIERKYILETANNFLGQDQVGVLNAIKSAVKDRKYSEVLKEKRANMQNLIGEKNEIMDQYNRLKAKLKDKGDDQVKQLEDEQQQLKAELDDLRYRSQELTTTDPDDLARLTYNNNIPLCERAYKDLEEKVTEATNTIELKRKSLKIKKYLKQIEQVALEKLKKKIIDDTNKKLEKIVKTESLVVEKIDGHLKLLNKDGASEGQSLAIAYSYLGSLFAASDHRLPFVVDSPAGSLDLDVRREVSLFLPELYEQLIIFITSGERDGFAEHFYNIGEDEVQFLTVINNKTKPTELKGGIEVFKNFQDKKLEEQIEHV